MDSTYYVILRKNNNFKLLIIFGFNIKINKIVIGSIILIKNINQETIIKIFKYFVEIINIDCNISEIITIKKIFNDSKLIICYYHILKLIIQYLPQKRSSDKIKKRKAHILLYNTKIMLFIKKDEVTYYFNLILEKYYNDFPKILKFFI